MKKISIVFLLLTLAYSAYAQVDNNNIFPLEAVVAKTPTPRITLNWGINPTDNTSFYYQVERSINSGSSWTILVTYIDQKTFVDSTINIGHKYIYKVSRKPKNQGTLPFSLYSNKIETGIELPEINFRGGVVLVATQKSFDSLQTQLEYYEQILQRDGWKTKLIKLPASAMVTSVKDSVSDVYNDLAFGLKSIILIGNVPVPYSGDQNPDGHSDHLGAWVADQYYADFIGTWTDNTVNNTTASRSANHNIPGDGKFDQKTVTPEIAIGRIDFSKLPKFSLSETQLLRKYLTKDIDFRKGLKQHRRRCIVKDAFGSGFALNGVSATTVLGIDSVFIMSDFRNTLNAESYLFSYGAGPGTYINSAGIMSTDNFVADSLKTVFNMLFGSYFGDYDINNNLLRAAIASGNTLTTIWGGWSGFSYYKMGLGGTVGDNFLKRIDAPYYCVIGDPSLTAFPFDTVSNVQLTKANNEITVTWNPCPIPNLVGYNVYRKKSGDNYYQKINLNKVSSTTYTDIANNKGKYIYMVRAINLEKTASGTFYNLNLGTISDTTNVNTIVNTSYSASIKSCSAYTSPSGKLWTISGTYNDTIANYLGNDSLITINLTVGHPTTASLTIYHCGAGYFSPSGKHNWTSSGIYHDTIPNSMGCDSLLTINFTMDTINHSPVIFNSVTTCNYYLSPSKKYIWFNSGTYFDTLSNPNSCDSIIITNLIIDHNRYVMKITNVYCDSFYVSPSGKYTWTVNGLYKDTIPSVYGCDSVMDIYLFFYAQVTRYLQIGYLDCVHGYTSPSGKHLFTSGLHYDTLHTAIGCDTVFMIWIAGYESIYLTSFCDPSFIYHSPSGKYTWNQDGTYSDTLTSSTGCDSIFRISLFVDTVMTNYLYDTILCNGSLTSPSGKYVWTNPGYYRDTLQSVNGCDSIFYFNLSTGTIHATFVIHGDTFIANYYSGCTYQWLDCNNNFAPVAGATQQKFVPTLNGNYAVSLTLNSCTDTSLCRFYTNSTASIQKQQTNLIGLLVYPNPTQGYITIKTSDDAFLNANIEIYNSMGQLVSVNKFTGNEANLLIHTPAGIYFVRAVNHGVSSAVIKVVKTY